MVKRDMSQSVGLTDTYRGALDFAIPVFATGN